MTQKISCGFLPRAQRKRTSSGDRSEKLQSSKLRGGKEKNGGHEGKIVELGKKPPKESSSGPLRGILSKAPRPSRNRGNTIG